jgi:hypothetical protein
MLRLIGHLLFLLSFASAQALTCHDLFGRVVQNGYRLEVTEGKSVLWGKEVPYLQVMNPVPDSVVPATQIKKKSFFQNPLAELFMKIVRPGLLEKWKIQKFDISKIVASPENELVLGLDVNHMYLILRWAGKTETIRADGGAFAPFFVRKNSNLVSDGVFFRLPNLTDKQMATAEKIIGHKDRYATCTEAACWVLKEIGITVGPSGKGVPSTTEEALPLIFREGFRVAGNEPFKAEIFTTSVDPLNKNLQDAIEVSRLNKEVRDKSINGFLGIIKYGGKTALHWIFANDF